jgi:predicted NAD-dependent protein-ADP-ribosyltransferase YbiA (DUF1768 family)
MRANEFEALLSGDIAEVARTVSAAEPRLQGLIYDPLPPVPRSGLFSFGREMEAQGRIIHLSLEGPLVNSAAKDFVLDGERYASVESFYHSLKMVEGSPERAACAMAPASQALRLARRIRRADFQYRGRKYGVNSPDHAALVARAILGKIDQNQEVAEALRVTGRSLLVIRAVHRGAAINVLGRVTPLVLMVERWKRWG